MPAPSKSGRCKVHPETYPVSCKIVPCYGYLPVPRLRLRHPTLPIQYVDCERKLSYGLYYSPPNISVIGTSWYLEILKFHTPLPFLRISHTSFHSFASFWWAASTILHLTRATTSIPIAGIKHADKRKHCFDRCTHISWTYCCGALSTFSAGRLTARTGHSRFIERAASILLFGMFKRAAESHPAGRVLPMPALNFNHWPL